MPNRERRLERADRLTERDLLEVGNELRRARLRAGLTLDNVSSAAGIGSSTVLRQELGQSPGIRPRTLGRHAAVVGMRARIKVYPDGAAIHDAAQLDLIRRLRERIGQSGTWAFEVPIPIPGDQRAFDAVMTLPSGRVGLEFYTRLADVQAQLRQAHLKQRDANLERLVIVVRGTSTNRQALREGAPGLMAEFPGGTRRTLARLQAGELPDQNAVVVL